jgi:hypothetical protein
MVEQRPPIVLQGAALWLLLLALWLSDERVPRPAARRRVDAAPTATACPFCGAPFDERRLCWCGADGHWF